jgi:hypothetical protein
MAGAPYTDQMGYMNADPTGADIPKIPLYAANLKFDDFVSTLSYWPFACAYTVKAEKLMYEFNRQFIDMTRTYNAYEYDEKEYIRQVGEVVSCQWNVDEGMVEWICKRLRELRDLKPAALVVVQGACGGVEIQFERQENLHFTSSVVKGFKMGVNEPYDLEDDEDRRQANDGAYTNIIPSISDVMIPDKHKKQIENPSDVPDLTLDISNDDLLEAPFLTGTTLPAAIDLGFVYTLAMMRAAPGIARDDKSPLTLTFPDLLVEFGAVDQDLEAFGKFLATQDGQGFYNVPPRVANFDRTKLTVADVAIKFNFDLNSYYQESVNRVNLRMRRKVYPDPASYQIKFTFTDDIDTDSVMMPSAEPRLRHADAAINDRDYFDYLRTNAGDRSRLDMGRPYLRYRGLDERVRYVEEECMKLGFMDDSLTADAINSMFVNEWDEYLVVLNGRGNAVIAPTFVPTTALQGQLKEVSSRTFVYL